MVKGISWDPNSHCPGQEMPCLLKAKLSLYLTKLYAMKTYPVLKAPRHKHLRVSGGVAPHISVLGGGWRRVVSFTPQPLYPRRKSSRYPLDSRLGGPQSRSGRSGEDKNSQPGIEPRSSSQYPSLYWLSCPGFPTFYWILSFIMCS
jgi:hypothetical protein